MWSATWATWAVTSWRLRLMVDCWRLAVNWRVLSKLHKPMDSSGRKNSHSLILVHRYEEELARQIETLEKYMER